MSNFQQPCSQCGAPALVYPDRGPLCDECEGGTFKCLLCGKLYEQQKLTAKRLSLYCSEECMPKTDGTFTAPRSGMYFFEYFDREEIEHMDAGQVKQLIKCKSGCLIG